TETSDDLRTCHRLPPSWKTWAFVGRSLPPPHQSHQTRAMLHELLPLEGPAGVMLQQRRTMRKADTMVFSFLDKRMHSVECCRVSKWVLCATCCARGNRAAPGSESLSRQSDISCAGTGVRFSRPAGAKPSACVANPNNVTDSIVSAHRQNSQQKMLLMDCAM